MSLPQRYRTGEQQLPIPDFAISGRPAPKPYQRYKRADLQTLYRNFRIRPGNSFDVLGNRSKKVPINSYMRFLDQYGPKP